MNDPNWLGLLKWSLRYSDGTSPSAFNNMSDEDKVWLEQVMKEAVRDDAQVMSEIMNKLNESVESQTLYDSEEVVENHLLELRDIIEQIDMAQVFAKFHGSQILLQFVQIPSIDEEIKAMALSVIATVAQNNLVTQDLYLNNGVLETLVSLFNQEESSTVLITKLLYAISCLIRGHAFGEEKFVLEYFPRVISKALSFNKPSLLSKVFFLCNALLTSDHSTLHRIQLMVSQLIPSLLLKAFSCETIDVRDNALLLIGNLLSTQHGWDVIHAHANDFDLFMKSLKDLISKELDLTSEEKSLEIRRLIALQQKYNTLNILFPLQPEVINHNNDNNNANNNNQEENQPVLMIGP